MFSTLRYYASGNPVLYNNTALTFDQNHNPVQMGSAIMSGYTSGWSTRVEG